MHEVWLCEQAMIHEEVHPEAQDLIGGIGDDHETEEGGPLLTKRKAVVEEELLPCHYFDFMFGTSSGGLIATLLGRLRLTVDESLKFYRVACEDMFGRRRSSIPLMTKYHHEPLEKALQDIVGARCGQHANCDGKKDLFPLDADRFPEILQRPVPFDVDEPRPCHTCCLTATHDENIAEAYLLRTYPHYYSETAPNWITRYNEGANELPIWKVVRATTATPFFFETMNVEGDGGTRPFKDGGIRENNPSGAALSEFHAMYESKASSPALLLSVGAGRPGTSHDTDGSGQLGSLGNVPLISGFLEKRAAMQNSLVKVTEGERQHFFMREQARGEHTWYKRLNISEGLQQMPLDEWRAGRWNGNDNVPGGATLTAIEGATAEYLLRDFDPAIDSYAPPSVKLRQAAEKLVRQRRAREEMGGPRWEAFIWKSLAK